MADELAQAAVAAIDRSFGEHEGRAVHIKGGWAQGSFIGTPAGTALCRAPFLRGDPVPTLVRLSNGSVFDPLRLCDGIEPSDDPILHFRRRAYDVSARRRWAGS